MTPEQTTLANNLLKLRDVFTELLVDEQNELGVYWQPSTPFSRKAFISFEPSQNLSLLCKGASNVQKINRILVYLRYLNRVELLVLLNEFEQELARLGVEVKPAVIPELKPPPDDDSQTPRQPPLEPA